MSLTPGIERFQQDVFPGMQPHFQELADGQSPETLFITCSDSRIDPNLITQTKPGELFVIRNAGNIVPKPGRGEVGLEATMQYAIDVLKVKRIVVCGHSHCGAMAGLLDRESLNELPAVKQWVSHSEAVLGRLTVDSGVLNEAIQANVLLQLEHLRLYPFVASAIETGQLELQGWVYHFESGQVEMLSEPAVV